jgi:ElaB/YqjD/DUF883 family membrane-anchored ribosome-binding protein
MQHRGRNKDIVDNSPLASPEGADMTQQSGYTPVREERSPYTGDTERDASMGDESAAGMSGGGRARREASAMTQKAREQASQVADEATTTAGESMESVASKLREGTEGQGGMAGQAGTKVADSMENTASYLKEHDTQEMLDDLERYVREHPMQALAGAIVGGFLIGRVFR